MTDDLRERVRSIIADLQANARDFRRHGFNGEAQLQEQTAIRLTKAIQDTE